jgi:L-alanine-DL-glutamate epimerase-like enolase superfamily enzyme
MMQVERAETVRYALPFRTPYATARGVIERREMVLLRLRTDAELEGLGEAVPLALRGDAPIAEIERAISDAANRLTGLDLDASAEDPQGFAVATMLELTAPRRLAPAAAAALEGALFDLVAKISGQPLWRFLGSDDPQPVECNATLTAGDPDAVASQAAEWAASGYATFKLKLGAGHDDVATVAAVREALGPGRRIRVDANEAWSPREAARVLAGIEPYDIELAEQPVAGLRGLAKLARDTEIPLAADESVATEADAHRAVQRRACAFATAKLSKVGGAGAARRIGGVLPTYLSSALDGPVGIAAAALAVQLLLRDGNDPGVAHGLATQRLFADTVARRECELREGRLHLPDGPGLGVEIDEAALARHRIAAG